MYARSLVKYAILAAALSLGLQAADRGAQPRFASLSQSDAVRALSGFEQLDTSAAMWVWSDKSVYTPGQQLTLHWTAKPNGDLFPYTIVAYRQNNQTGEKTYLPNGTSTATDIFGNTVEQGFNIVRLPEANKTVLAGSGGMFPAITIPNELGMHTIVVEIREYTGGRVIKAAYWKIGVVSGFETLGGDVTTETTLVNTKAYNLTSLLIVKNGGVLNIEPGTFIFGANGSAIIVGTSGRIEAHGTRARPIIMTSNQPYGQRRGGDWGGLVLIGLAPSNWPGGTGEIEGLPSADYTTYGGNDPTHNCGTLTYVRVEFAGSEFGPNNELNAFTFAACGTDTKVSHVESIYGLDDSFEWFGGTSNGDHMVSLYPRDDHFDSQIGWVGKVQYFVGVGNADDTNRGFEMDDNENDYGAVPVNMPTFFNGTFYGAGDLYEGGTDEPSVAGMFLRRGTGGSMNNIIIQNWVDTGIFVNDTETQNRFGTGELSFNGIMLWKNGVFSGATNDLAGQVSTLGQTYIATAPNILVADPLLRRPSEYSDPDFRPKTNSPVFRANWVQPPDDGFFDQSARYNGAFADEDWTEEWTTFIQEQDLVP